MWGPERLADGRTIATSVTEIYKLLQSLTMQTRLATLNNCGPRKVFAAHIDLSMILFTSSIGTAISYKDNSVH